MKKAFAVKLKTGKWKILGIHLYRTRGIEYSLSNDRLYVSLLKFNPNIDGLWSSSLSIRWPVEVEDILWQTT